MILLVNPRYRGIVLTSSQNAELIFTIFTNCTFSSQLPDVPGFQCTRFIATSGFQISLISELKKHLFLSLKFLFIHAVKPKDVFNCYR